MDALDLPLWFRAELAHDRLAADPERRKAFDEYLAAREVILLALDDLAGSFALREDVRNFLAVTDGYAGLIEESPGLQAMGAQTLAMRADREWPQPPIAASWSSVFGDLLDRAHAAHSGGCTDAQE